MSLDLAIPASPAALRNEASGFLPLTAKAASLSGIGYARRNGVTLCIGQYQGGFALCTVEGVEILDGSFHRITEIVVDQPKDVYVRQTNPSEPLNSYLIDFATEEPDGVPVGSVADVEMRRIGRSQVFLSEPITLEPQAGWGGSAAPQFVQAAAPKKTVSAPRGRNGKGKAKRNQRTMAQCLIGGRYAAETFVDTTVDGKSYRGNGAQRNPSGGKHANLLFADEQETTQISVWVHEYSPETTDTPGVQGVRLYARLADGKGTLISGGAAVSIVPLDTDANGWAQITYRAPGSQGFAAGEVSRARIELSGGDDQAWAKIASAYVYSYGTFDFRNLPFSLDDFTSPGVSASQVQSVFQRYRSGEASFLARFYLKGLDGFWDSTGRCNYTQTCNWNGSDPAYRSPMGCRIPEVCDLDNPQLTGTLASQKLYDVASQLGINAYFLMVLIQREKGLLGEASLPDQASLSQRRRLDYATGCNGAPGFLEQLACCASTVVTHRDSNEAPLPSGPYFFSTADVPIESYLARETTTLLTRAIGYSAGGCSVFPDVRIDRYNVAFTAAKRADYIVWQYNPWVQVCTQGFGGGQRELIEIANKIRQLASQ